MITFTPPKKARIIDSKYHQFDSTLARMGLAKPEFRAVGETRDKSQVFVHPDDINLPSNGGDFAIRRDIVQFLPDE